MNDRIVHDPSNDGVDRRGFLKCMAWAGTGLVWAVSGGIPGCTRVEQVPAENTGDEAEPPSTSSFTFVQVR